MAITPAGEIAIALSIIAMFGMMWWYFQVAKVWQHYFIELNDQRRGDRDAAAAEERDSDAASVEAAMDGAGGARTRDRGAGTR